MTAKKLTALVALAACALALAALGSAKNPVERPFKAQGHVTVVVNLLNGNWHTVDWGEATHFGRYINEGWGYTDTEGNPVGGGYCMAANGDKAYWQRPGSQWTSDITGGTGRFENASGGMNIVSQSESEFIPSPDPTLLMFTFTYTAVGIIKY